MVNWLPQWINSFCLWSCAANPRLCNDGPFITAPLKTVWFQMFHIEFLETYMLCAYNSRCIEQTVHWDIHNKLMDYKILVIMFWAVHWWVAKEERYQFLKRNEIVIASIENWKAENYLKDFPQHYCRMILSVLPWISAKWVIQHLEDHLWPQMAIFIMHLMRKKNTCVNPGQMLHM